MDLKERTKWAISFVARKKKLSNHKIGKIIGVKADTVNSYRSKLANPKVDFIIKFCDSFGIDLFWLAKAEGEPFPGAKDRFPELCTLSRYENGRSEDIQTTTHSDTTISSSDFLDKNYFEKNIVINATEKSLSLLCRLTGIPITRGWKSALAGYLEITPSQLSNSISRNKLSNNLLLQIEKKGYPPEKWLAQRTENESTDEQSSSGSIDAEMSLQRLALLLGIKIYGTWIFYLANALGLEPRHLIVCIQSDLIDDEMINYIEIRGYSRHTWIVKKEPNVLSLKKHDLPGDYTELLKMAEAVLLSKTIHATTLAMNIISLNTALVSEKNREGKRLA